MYFLKTIILILSERDYVIQVIILLTVVFYFLNLILQSFLARLFQIQFYPHFYFIVKKLDSKGVKILNENFQFYNKLSSRNQKYFDHRVALFINKYEFHSKEGLDVTPEMKVIVAGSFTVLTFRMTDFRPKVFDKIILYPNSYVSSYSGLEHKGEFNPKMKSIVFSWPDFLAGLQINNDNLNLGLHEFTHVLQCQSKLSQSPSYIIFDDMVDKINSFLKSKDNKNQIVNSNYLRNYAFSNEFEFLAVLMEHFFESPAEFKSRFPQLFVYVKKMINFKED
jgi:MtfA peptidase